MNGKRKGPACRPPAEKVIMPVRAGSGLRRQCCWTEPVRAHGRLGRGSRRCEAQPRIADLLTKIRSVFVKAVKRSSKVEAALVYAF